MILWFSIWVWFYFGYDIDMISTWLWMWLWYGLGMERLFGDSWWVGMKKRNSRENFWSISWGFWSWYDFDMVSGIILIWYSISWFGIWFWHGFDMILTFCQNIYPNNTTKPEYTKVTTLSHAKITILSHIRITLKQCQNHKWNTRPQTNVSNNKSDLNHIKIIHTCCEYPSSWASWCHKFKHVRNSHLMSFRNIRNCCNMHANLQAFTRIPHELWGTLTLCSEI